MSTWGGLCCVWPASCMLGCLVGDVFCPGPPDWGSPKQVRDGHRGDEMVLFVRCNSLSCSQAGDHGSDLAGSGTRIRDVVPKAQPLVYCDP